MKAALKGVLLLAVALALVVSGAAQAQGQGRVSDPSQAGPYAVGHANYVFFDPSRWCASNKPTKQYWESCFTVDQASHDKPSALPIAASVWYPADAGTVTASAPPAQYPLDPLNNYVPVTTSYDWEAFGILPAHEGIPPSTGGPFPLLVFSPAGGTTYAVYIPLGTYLASHGYVVVVLEHWADHIWRWQTDLYLGSVLALFRGLDISFSISQLLARNASADDLLNGVIDQDRIAAGGHSLGGGGAYSVAAGDDLFCDARYLSLLVGDPWPIDWLCIGVSPDSRVKAIIPIDAVSENSRFEELARISVPSLILTQPVENLLAYGYGSEAKGGRPHVAIDRGDSYRIDFGSTHYMFFNVCAYIRVAYGYGVMTAEWAAYNLDYHKCNPGQGLSPEEGQQITNTYVVAFLNSHLGIGDQRWVLTAGYAASHELPVRVFQNESCSGTVPSDAYFAYREFPNSSECRVAERDPAIWFKVP